MICDKCIVKAMCREGCRDLLDNIKDIKIKDFQDKNLGIRITTLWQKFGCDLIDLDLNFGHLKFFVDEDEDGIYYTFIKEEGIMHREDGPSLEYQNGYKEWCKNGDVLIRSK